MISDETTIRDIRDLAPQEQLALGALIRMVLTADGTVSVVEREVMDVLAKDLGPDAFWSMFDEAAAVVTGPEHARELASKVERRPAQVFIYMTVAELGMAGSVTRDQMMVLESLRLMWGIEERRVSSAYRDG